MLENFIQLVLSEKSSNALTQYYVIKNLSVATIYVMTYKLFIGFPFAAITLAPW